MNKKTQMMKRVAVILLVTASLMSSLAQADTQLRSNNYEYTAQGLLSKEVSEPNRPNDCLQSTYVYDSFGNKTSMSASACAGATGATLLSAATARTSTNSYGSDGRFVVSSTNALNQSETKAYDSRFGGITSLTGPNGLTSTWIYDSFGRKVRESRSDGTYTTWSYKLCSESGANCPSTVGPATVVWVSVEQSYAANAAISAPEKRLYQDNLSRVVRLQTQGFDGVGAAATVYQDTEYNAQGQVARQSRMYASTDSPMWTTFEYDALGRVTSESHPDAGGIAITAFSYNALSTTRTRTVAALSTDIQGGQWAAPTITASQGPSPWVGNQAATLSWSSTNASVVTYKCTSTGAGFTANQSAAALSGTTASVTASDAWVANPSTCVFTAAGPGGTATYNLTVTTLPEPAFSFTATITADTLNYNLRAAAVAAGWSQTAPLAASITVNSGVYVGSSSTAAYSFDTGATFPVGSTLKLINNGFIVGKGGTGGSGNTSTSWTIPDVPGQPGGAALRVQYALNVINNGVVGGGGGGGGQGGGGGGGGGGGAGYGIGLGGAAGAMGSGVGGNGTATSGGSGGGQGYDTGGTAVYPSNWWEQYSGTGGAGGTLGATGVQGGYAYYDNEEEYDEGITKIGALGGAGGAAVVGNANVTWTVAGTRLGALQ